MFFFIGIYRRMMGFCTSQREFAARIDKPLSEALAKVQFDRTSSLREQQLSRM
jgi:hypothetical protein